MNNIDHQSQGRQTNLLLTSQIDVNYYGHAFMSKGKQLQIRVHLIYGIVSLFHKIYSE